MTTYVNSGQTVENQTISDSQQVIRGGGTAKYETIENNGEVVVENDGKLIEVNDNGDSWYLTTQGRAVVYSGGLVSGGYAYNGGSYIVSGGGIAKDITVGSGGKFSGPADSILSGNNLVTNGGSVSGGTITSGSTLRVTGGGHSVSTTVTSGATLTVSGGGTLADTTVNSGGTLSGAPDTTIESTVTLDSGASVTIPSTAGGSVVLNGNDTSLTITGSGNPSTVISGFTGQTSNDSDGIILSDLSPSQVSRVTYPDADHVELALKNGQSVTLHVIGVRDLGYNLSAGPNGALQYTVCFLKDTAIAVPGGTKAVQDMAVGDTVLVMRDGVCVPDTVTWAGHAHCDIRHDLPDDLAGYPVRIVRNAVADNVPARDLLVTAEHCIYLDGRFVPARMLVNGRTIFYDRSITSYDYFHIETEKHALLTAEGLLTESYLDTGNRHGFAQSGKVFRLGGKPKSWITDAAAPLCVARDVVEALHAGLAARAEALDAPRNAAPPNTTTDADLHLVTESGVMVSAARQAGNRAVFLLPAHTHAVRIVSSASRPSDAIGPFVDDRRMLGVLVGGIMLYDDETSRPVHAHLHDEKLAGWHGVEPGVMRWTDGDAYLPLPPHASGGASVLTVQILAAGPYVVSGNVSATRARVA